MKVLLGLDLFQQHVIFYGHFLYLNLLF